MLTERTIINGLILLASFTLVPFVVAETLSYDYLPALIAGAIFLILVSFFFVKEKLAIYPLLGLSIQGTFNFLPLTVGASQIAALLLTIYYIVGFVLLAQRPIRVGKPVLFLPILILNGIILYHVHSLSLNSVGENTEGARPAFFIYLYTLAYICGINLPTPSVYFLSRIPFYAICLTCVSSIPFLLSTFYPALAPYLYSVTSSVNVEAYVNTSGGTEDAGLDELGSRLAAFGAVGTSIQLYLLAHYPIGTWLSPRRLWVACLSMICFISAIFCGYRSGLFSFLFLTFVGIACYYSWRALIFPGTVFVAALIFFTASENKVIQFPVDKLPMIAQRTMSFLPGDWDPDAIESGKSSNEFRQNIIDVYLQEYADVSPLFGNGFDIDKDEVESLEKAYDRGEGDSMYLQAKIFIATKAYHTGWVSVYDCVGIVGWMAYIWFQLALIFIAGSFIFRRNADRHSSLFPLYVWIFCSVMTEVVSYYTVFGDFAGYFLDELCYAILIVHLCTIQKQNELASGSEERKNQVEFSGLSQANYGNKYY